MKLKYQWTYQAPFRLITAPIWLKAGILLLGQLDGQWTAGLLPVADQPGQMETLIHLDGRAVVRPVSASVHIVLDRYCAYRVDGDTGTSAMLELEGLQGQISDLNAIPGGKGFVALERSEVNGPSILWYDAAFELIEKRELRLEAEPYAVVPLDEDRALLWSRYLMTQVSLKSTETQTVVVDHGRGLRSVTPYRDRVYVRTHGLPLQVHDRQSLAFVDIFDAYIFQDPAFDENRIYTVDHDTMRCFSLPDHDLLWKQTLKAKGRAGFMDRPAIQDGRVLIGSRSDFLWSLDARTGEVLDKSEMASTIDKTPAVRGNLAVVEAVPGKLHCFQVDADEHVAIPPLFPPLETLQLSKPMQVQMYDAKSDTLFMERRLDWAATRTGKSPRGISFKPPDDAVYVDETFYWVRGSYERRQLQGRQAGDLRARDIHLSDQRRNPWYRNGIGTWLYLPDYNQDVKGENRPGWVPTEIQVGIPIGEERVVYVDEYWRNIRPAIMAVNPETHQQRLIYRTKPEEDLSRPSVSPDGTIIAFLTGHYEYTTYIMFYDLKTDKLIRKVDPDSLFPTWRAPKWAADGSGLVLKAGQGDSLFVYHADLEGNLRFIYGDKNGSVDRWIVDKHNRMIFNSKPNQLSFIPLANYRDVTPMKIRKTE